MAVCVDFASGALTQLQSSVAECTGYVLVTASEYNSFTVAFELDPYLIGLSLTFGVGLIVATYYMVYPVEIATKAIKMIR